MFIKCRWVMNPTYVCTAHTQTNMQFFLGISMSGDGFVCQWDYCTLCVCVCVCLRGHDRWLSLLWVQRSVSHIKNEWVCTVYVCRWQSVPEVPAVYGSLQERGRGSMPGLVAMATTMWISLMFWICVCCASTSGYSICTWEASGFLEFQLRR